MTLDEEQRQAVLFALALCSRDRPGWHDFLAEIADQLHGRSIYELALDQTAPTCRRCGDCRDARHHWVDEMEVTHRCKHCGALGSVCPECMGEGCDACGEEGVTEVIA